jgi:hypothetical protein
MGTILQNLSSALLITLIVILAYILYKRLLNVLQKDRLSAKYFSVESFVVNRTHPALHAEITIKMNQPDVISIKCLDSQLKKNDALFTEHLAEGLHHLNVDLSATIQSPNKLQIEVSSATQSWVKSL